MLSRRGGRGDVALGGDLIDFFGPGVGHLNYLIVLPGVGVIELLLTPAVGQYLTIEGDCT